ncbi:MAG: BACON domain-containing protein [Bacteroidales bacterium]|nr:BACON domain-containing protein [Bacteroidales bacterium]
MKKFVMFIALMLNFVIGGAVGAAVGVNPFITGGALSGISLVIPFITDGLKAGIYTEVWTGEMVKAFRSSVESIGWLNEIRDYSQYADNDVIHFVNLGGDPTVLINNTSYPLGIESLNDTDKPIGLDKYQTKATAITDDELHAVSFDKMGSVIERHKDAINESKYAKALSSLAPGSHSTATPVILTTGTNSADGLRKRITKSDIITLKKSFDDAKIPTAGRILVLCSDHVNDLLETDQKFADQYYNYTTGKIANLYGFKVYEYTSAPHYTVATKTKLAYGAAVDPDTDRQASIAFYAPRMFKATGSTTPYLSEAKNDPLNQQNLANFRHYFIALPLKNEAIGAIVSDVAAGGEEEPVEGSVTAAPTELSFTADGGTQYIAVTATGAFSVTCNNVAFVVSIEGNAVKVVVGANGELARTANISITLDSDPTITTSVTATQAEAE